MSINPSLNGQNWANYAVTSSLRGTPFDDESSELFNKQSPDNSPESSSIIKQMNPFELSTFPNDLSQVAPLPYTEKGKNKNADGTIDSFLDVSNVGFGTKQVNIFDSNFVLVDNMFDVSLSKAATSPGKRAGKSLMLDTSRYYDQTVSPQYKACIEKVTRGFCASLPSKVPNRGLMHFLSSLERNSSELVLNALTLNMRTYSMEQDDLLEIEETPHFRDNPYYEAFCNLLASTNYDQKIVNLDLVSLLIKLSVSNRVLKEVLLFIPVRRVEKGKGVVYSSMIDFVLIDTIRVGPAD